MWGIHMEGAYFAELSPSRRRATPSTPANMESIFGSNQTASAASNKAALYDTRSPLSNAILAGSLLAFIPLFWLNSPASKSTKLWSAFYTSIFAAYTFAPAVFKALWVNLQTFAYGNPRTATAVALSVGVVLKYIQQKLRFARVNHLKWKYGFTEDLATFEDMTVEQAQEIESNMAEWEFPRLWQWGWLSDFFRTSTDPGVSRAITASGHFINEDKKVEHQRMQATLHMMTAFVAWKVKSPFHSLVIARINEHVSISSPCACIATRADVFASTIVMVSRSTAMMFST